MKWKNTSRQFSDAMIAIHWLMLLLLVSVYACIELRELYPKGSDTREMLKSWHFMLGLSVFACVWLRLILRFFQRVPVIETPMPRWQAILAARMHLALYLLMIVMPLAGWLILSAEGKDIPFFGLELPALVAENEALGELIEEIHATIGQVGYFLIGLHAAAALIHHYFHNDETLTRMIPALKRR